MKTEKRDFTNRRATHIAKAILEHEIRVTCRLEAFLSIRNILMYLDQLELEKQQPLLKLQHGHFLKKRRKLVLSQQIHIELRQLSSFVHMRIYCKHLWKLLITVQDFEEAIEKFADRILFSLIQQDEIIKKLNLWKI